MGAWLSTLPASTMSLEMQDALGCRMLWLQPGAAALSLPFLHPRRQGSQLGAGRRWCPAPDIVFSSGIRLVWGVHGAISTRPLASCGLNAQVPPASQPPGRNLKCFQHLGGSYAAGTEIWEQKEENNLCKRPWPAHDGEDESVTGLPRKKSSCIQHSDKPNARKAYLKGSFEIK